jgi:peptide/nickel transport system substrate-binding protein
MLIRWTHRSGPDQYGYSREIHPHYTHDPAKAKKLLAQAGYPNGFDGRVF